MILFMSPRKTVLNQMEEFLRISTFPIIQAVGATKTELSIWGINSLKVKILIFIKLTSEFFYHLLVQREKFLFQKRVRVQIEWNPGEKRFLAGLVNLLIPRSA